MKLHPEEVDLAELAHTLRGTFFAEPPEGYLEGRTAVRDVVRDRLGCSELEAEEIVDTMVSQGFLRFTGDARGAFEGGFWRVDNLSLESLEQFFGRRSTRPQWASAARLEPPVA